MAGATIVFCDIVRFSMHSDDEQRGIVNALNALVTHELYPYIATNDGRPEVISLPTGDGIALAFVNPDRSWTEVLFGLIKRLMNWSVESPRSDGWNISIRIGVHCGEVCISSDINRRANVCGATINECQRIMDAAHPNQVLFSDAAFARYVGRGKTTYAKPPFTDTHAIFAGPFEITAKHDVIVHAHIMHLKDDDRWSSEEPYPRGDILGRLPRTRFIVNRLNRVRCTKDQPFRIFEQSAFSSFGPGEAEAWQDEPEVIGEYRKYRLLQKTSLDILARAKQINLQLIIDPKRNIATPDTIGRIKSLLEWMTDPEIKNLDNVDFVIAEFTGPNRLIVEGSFSIDGYKSDMGPGYDLSVLHTDPHRVDQAIGSFTSVFQKAKAAGFATKDHVIQALRQLQQFYESQKDTSDDGSGGFTK